MQETKRVLLGRTFLFGFIVVFLVNAVLFYNEQKENSYGLPLSVANEVVWNADGQITIGHDVSAEECYEKYVGWLNRYKNTDMIQAQTELAERLPISRERIKWRLRRL